MYMFRRHECGFCGEVFGFWFQDNAGWEKVGNVMIFQRLSMHN